MYIAISLGKKRISGRKIHKALQQITPERSFGNYFATDVWQESIQALEFIPRATDWHYLDTYAFVFRAELGDYKIQILPINPILGHRELMFAIYSYASTGREDEYLTKLLEFSEEDHALIIMLSSMCTAITNEILQQLKLI